MNTLHPSLLLSTLALACQVCTAQTIYAPTPGEYNWSTTVNQLGMRGVHSRGVLGQGVIVAVLDSGLNLSNPEFQGNSRVLTGYNAVDGSSNITDTLLHGTHVAGIIAAPGNGTGMYGVAPGASLLAIKVFNGGTASSSTIDRGLDYASTHGARVVNMSLGATSQTGDAALRRVAATNNTVVVVAAGNESARNPNWPARYAKEAWANGTILAVGAVDANKRLASFSNKAGDTAAYFLVAPGVSIISSYGTGYAYLTGTSMATPAVSGAAALITGYWPYLRANQVAAILLNTADDLGAPGVDAVYGHGMLNVNKALSPIGSYTYRVSTGNKVTVPLSTAGVVSTQPSVSTPSAFKGLQTEVFDEYGRNFTSDEGAALSAHSVMTLDSVLGRPDRMLDAADQMLRNGSRLMRLQSRQIQASPSTSAEFGKSGAPWNHFPDADAGMVTLQTPSGHTLSAGDGGLAGMSLGLMGSSMTARLGGTENVLGNPLLGFAPRHQFAALALPLGQGWSSRVAVAHGQPGTPLREAAHGDVNVLELSYDNGHQAVNLSAAQLNEQGLLGGYSQPVMGLNQRTGTLGLTLSSAWLLDAHWALTGAITQTSTGAPSATGMLLSATSVQTRGWGLGLVRSDNWRQGDRLSLSVNAPLRAHSGSLTYSVVTSVDEQGQPLYGTHTVNLAAGGAQEWLTEARYVTRLGRDATLSAVATLRLHPDHDASAAAQKALGLRFSQAF